MPRPDTSDSHGDRAARGVVGRDAAAVLEPSWTAAAVARRLGVAPATLRSWSVRYGIGPPEHQPGRYRRYTSTDVAELETMRRLNQRGTPMATAVAIARTQHRPPTGPDLDRTTATVGEPDTGAGPIEVAALVDAAQRLDADTAVWLVGDSLTRRGVVATWNQLCRPALVDTASAPPDRGAIGSTARGEAIACIDADCILNWAVTTGLRRHPAPPAAPAGTSCVLLACAESEFHALPMDALFAALVEQHLPARTLGASVPGPALLQAAERTHPAATFVWAQTPHTAAPDLLTLLAAHTDRVIAAGPGWPGHTPPGVHPAATLREGIDQARHALHLRIPER